MISILLIGTCDTKADEILFLKSRLEEHGARAVIMDVGVLGTPPFPPDYSNHQVAAETGMTVADIVALGDESAAMSKMSEGAAKLAGRLSAESRVHGMLALGGTMGTDLALEVACALPLGLPKVIVSTIAFSPLIPPERIPADLMMMSWPGGLHGLNHLCRSVLSQAAGAAAGAACAGAGLENGRPIVAITSLGKSCLSYMVRLKPELERRGYDVMVFHSTGMGGRAFESLAQRGHFAAVLDLCLQELSNELAGSVVTAGASRLEAAGRAGIPQIIAPGATDMVDFPAWKGAPERHREQPLHAHNRLIASTTTGVADRARLARVIGEKLALAKGSVRIILPLRGIEQWDRPGEPLHDPEGLTAFIGALRKSVRMPAELVEIDAHINDPAFSDEVLKIFDQWASRGIIPPGQP